MIPRRLLREIQFRCSSGSWRLGYTPLNPNLTEYIYTDCDAFSSLDPHEAVLLFLRWGMKCGVPPVFFGGCFSAMSRSL